MAAGLKLADLQDGYTLGQIKLFARAAALNRQDNFFEQAEATALGIAEAFQPQGGLLQKLRQSLAKQESQPTKQVSETTRKFFAGAPVMVKPK